MIEIFSLSELTINFLETAIFIFLLYHCVSLRYSTKCLPVIAILHCLTTTVCGHLIPNSTQKSMILCFLTMLLIFPFLKNFSGNDCFIVAVYSALCFFSEKFVLVILMNIPAIPSI